MLEIQEIELKIKISNKRKYKKNQIMLFDTFRSIDNYISKLKFRKNGEYQDVPHFVVSKKGEIFKILDPNLCSQTFNDPKVDKRLIKIAIENNGYLEKNNLIDKYINWIGDTHKGEIYTHPWKNKIYWDKYTDIQLIKVQELCDYICDEFKIKNNIVPTNNVIENINNFKGISFKSNYSNIYKDINPSFKLG